MIVFDLSCSNGHSFEVWFNSNDDYKEQNDKGLLICPYCECNKISKKLSAPKIKSSNNNQNPKQDFDIISLQKNSSIMLKKIPKMLGKNFQKLQGKFTITKLTPNLLEEVPQWKKLKIYMMKESKLWHFLIKETITN